MQEIESSRAQKYLIEIGAGNGVEVYLNGRSILKHLNPYRCTFRTEQVLLPLEKGKNQIVLRLYNRFEKRQVICFVRQRNRKYIARSSIFQKLSAVNLIL